MNTSPATLSESQFAKLRTLIAERSGLQFPAGRRYMLESRLTQRLAELDLEGFDDYLSLLGSDMDHTGELGELFSRVTINETSFFRDAAQFEALERSVLPTLLEARKNQRRLRIWSAACSTGQEAYSLAMLVSRLLSTQQARWTIEILGTDLSARVLEIASSGRYDELAVRGVPADFHAAAFECDGNHWTIAPHLRAMVRFERRNLVDPADHASAAAWDLIVCRNTMIYFAPEIAEQVLATFHRHLAPDGMLLVGNGESASDASGLFVPHGPAQAHGYRTAHQSAPQQPKAA